MYLIILKEIAVKLWNRNSGYFYPIQMHTDLWEQAQDLCGILAKKSILPAFWKVFETLLADMPDSIIDGI